MSITFELPAAIEQQLRGQWADFDAVAKEAALVELYRQRKLTHHQLGVALDLDRFAVDALLKRHQVMEDPITAEGLSCQLGSWPHLQREGLAKLARCA